MSVSLEEQGKEKTNDKFWTVTLIVKNLEMVLISIIIDTVKGSGF